MGLATYRLFTMPSVIHNMDHALDRGYLLDASVAKQERFSNARSNALS
jgi:hypothetical protein